MFIDLSPESEIKPKNLEVSIHEPGQPGQPGPPSTSFGKAPN
jgi:hypothetical protein